MKLKTPNNFPIVLGKLGKVDEKVLAGAEKGLRLGLEFTRTTVMREFLSGPRSKTKLDAVSGRLRGSIAIDVKRSGKSVVGRIGSNVKYARFHEFGFNGTVNVKAHTRAVVAGGGERGVKFIRERETREAGKIIKRGVIIGTKRESVKSAEARGVSFVRQQVGAHTRRINYAGRPFIKPALIKTQQRIKDTIITAINQANA